MNNQLLIENVNPQTSNLMEMMDKEKNLYLSGVIAQANVKNGNGRVYKLDEMQQNMNAWQERIKTGNFILGELNHPNTLDINLWNVSHAVTSVSMTENNVIAKLKIMKTAPGNIAKGLIEGGVRLACSTRGSGAVGADGMVSGFKCITVDLVADPSCRIAIPDPIYEAMQHKPVTTLAEAMIHDAKAQEYFRKEIMKLITAMSK
jgi:hypothetical protein